MRIASVLLASLALFAPSAWGQGTMMPPSSWGGPTSIPTAPAPVQPVQPVQPVTSAPTMHPTPAAPTAAPTIRPPHDHGHDGRKPEHQPSQHYCHKYLAHASCRQCVTKKGSLGFTPNPDLHWCPTPGTDHYDHLGSCQLITSPCLSSLSVPVTNITLCPNDPAPSKPSCGACTSDAYVWCQSDDKFDDEYMGVCKDASKLFSSRAMAEYILRQREERDDDSNVIDVIDNLCGPTHTAILNRRECPRKHHFTRGIMMAVLFHMIPILLCLSACCLCVRAIKRRRAARRQALLDVSATTPSAPSSSNEYPGVVSTTYPTDAPLPVPLPNGTYVAPAATAPSAVPMQVYPTLATPSSGLRAPLLQEDGLIYGHATAQGYQRVHQEI